SFRRGVQDAGENGSPSVEGLVSVTAASGDCLASSTPVYARSVSAPCTPARAFHHERARPLGVVLRLLHHFEVAGGDLIRLCDRDPAPPRASHPERPATVGIHVACSRGPLRRRRACGCANGAREQDRARENSNPTMAHAMLHATGPQEEGGPRRK